jgi:hypothetical protein
MEEKVRDWSEQITTQVGGRKKKEKGKVKKERMKETEKIPSL